jgi:cobalamin-dependent methionine synthase I
LEEAFVKDRELSPYHKIVELKRELEEQLRLNGMGSEREARLMARVAELERENAALRADKERYEWLKDGCGSAWAYKYLRNNFRINDDALDSARKEAQP